MNKLQCLIYLKTIQNQTKLSSVDVAQGCMNGAPNEKIMHA